MSAYTDELIVQYKILANQLTSAIAKNECLELIDQYGAALAHQATSVANDVSSYSIDGRSVTRSSQNTMQSQVSNLKAKINRLLYGSVTRVDMRLENIPES